jgi:hypothetical protein
MDSSDEHPLKEKFPIYITLSGMQMDFSDEHPTKASSPITVTVLGMSTVVSVVSTFPESRLFKTHLICW